MDFLYKINIESSLREVHLYGFYCTVKNATHQVITTLVPMFPK